MAVYTHVSADEVRTFLEFYDLGTHVSYAPIAAGVENTNYHVLTSHGRFILTIFEKRVRRGDLPFVFDFIGMLSRAGINVPRICPDKSGQTVGTLCAKPAAFQTFLDGAGRAPEAITVDDCAQVGALLAQMHLIGTQAKTNRSNPVGPAQWSMLCKAVLAHDDPAIRPYRTFVENALLGAEKYTHTNAPFGTVHADLFPDNVFFDEQGDLSGVIDFYFSCTAPLIYDFGLTFNAWCFDAQHALDFNKAAAFISAYIALRPLSETEKSEFPHMRRLAALRIFSTRFYDWFFTPPDATVTRKDPTEYKLKYECACPPLL